MNLFSGRVDRKTYIIGMSVVLSLTLILSLLFILPLAAIELIVPTFRDGGPGFLDKMALIIPVIFLVVSSFSLMIRRAHDLDSDGLIWLVGLFIALVARVQLDSVIASLLPLIVMTALALKTGTPRANRYGKKPTKKLKLENIYDLTHPKSTL